jgi:hypothetical protein
MGRFLVTAAEVIFIFTTFIVKLEASITVTEP